MSEITSAKPGIYRVMDSRSPHGGNFFEASCFIYDEDGAVVAYARERGTWKRCKAFLNRYSRKYKAIKEINKDELARIRGEATK